MLLFQYSSRNSTSLTTPCFLFGFFLDNPLVDNFVTAMQDMVLISVILLADGEAAWLLLQVWLPTNQVVHTIRVHAVRKSIYTLARVFHPQAQRWKVRQGLF